MFTVKHISLSGEERIYATPFVNYVPGSVVQSQSAPADPNKYPDTLWIEAPDGRRDPLTGGTVFVMNQFGKTVSRYDLGASPIPLDVDALRSANEARDRHERDAGPFEPRELPRQPMDIRRN